MMGWEPSSTRVHEARLDAETDEAARAQFDTAFDLDPRDDAWADTTEAAIAAAIESTSGALTLRAAECRSTLCRVELRGDRNALPPVAPFDGITWWLGDADSDATLLIVRDGAEIPLPADPEATPQ